MRFTPEILRKHAQILVDKEAKRDRSILAAYLRGSLLYGSPLLGGAGDIDLVFIHNSPPAKINQLIKLTPEIHFDIEHHDQILYQRPREVRQDAWLGPTIRDAQPLYDPRHFIDYTQAGVRSNYDFPENIQDRARPLIEKARQFWLNRQISISGAMLGELPDFLDALYNAVNAVALLSGPPLTTRRLGMAFPERAAAAGAPGLAMTFCHLIGGVDLSRETLEEWLAAWQKTIEELGQQNSPAAAFAEKRVYFQSAMKAILKSDNPTDMLWPLLTTWTKAMAALPEQSELQLNWKQALTTLGFAGKDYQIRLAVFDSFLDLCETLVLGESKET